MSQTTFDDNVIIDGSQDITQLTVEGHSTQTEPLQVWQDSAASPQAQVTGDGRLQLGDFEPDGLMATDDALIEAHRASTSAKPKRGFHALGRIGGTLSDAVTWAAHELELLGSGGVSGLHTTLRAKLTHVNAGDGSSGEFRAGDFQALNQTGSNAEPVGQVTGMRGTASNVPDDVNAYLSKAVGVEATVTNAAGGNISEAAAFEVASPQNDGTIDTFYGLKVADLDEVGASNVYAFHTGKGTTHLGDDLELPVFTSAPTNTPPANFLKLYPKLVSGVPNLFMKTTDGAEYIVGGGGASVYGKWDPFAPPITCEPESDEFDGSVLDTKWTEYDVSSSQTLAVHDGYLVMEHLSETGDKVTGVFQTMPSLSQWTIETHVVLQSSHEDYINAGLCLFKDAANNDNLLRFCLAHNNGYDVRLEYMWNNTTWGGVEADIWWRNDELFLRISYDGADYHFDFSFNGIHFTRLKSISNIDIVFAPTEFGLVMDHNSSYPKSAIALFDFFRVYDTPLSLDTPIQGQEIGVNGSASHAGQVWSPYLPPISSSLLDDEFDSLSLDSKWAEFDPDNLMSMNVDKGALWLTHAPHTPDNFCGIYQPLPSGDFTVETKVNLSGQYAAYQRAGLAFWVDAEDDTKEMVTWTLLCEGSPTSGNHRITMCNFTNYTSFIDEPFGYVHVTTDWVFLRVTREGTDYHFEWSLDGVTYQRACTEPIFYGGSPTHFGLVVDHNTLESTLDTVGRFEFFRYTDTALQPHETIGGGVARLQS